jgi:asparagine synthase (glutamine-hydrolysing)
VTSQSVDKNRKECVYGTFLRTDLDVLTTSSTSVSVVSEAKITPNADPSITNEEKDRQNILIGSLGNAGASDVYLQASRSSTGLDNSALKTCNLFETLGGKCFEGIDNQFVLFGWHKNLKQLHIAKDPLNPRSIYWAELTHGVLVSTNLQFITKALDNPLSLSDTGLASWLSGCPNPAISLFKNINVLPIGHRLEVSATLQTSSLKFWDIDPEYKIHYAKQESYAEQFVQGLSNSVANASESNANVVVSQMSGGMDSTSVTALANNQLTDLGKTVLPLSHLYKQAEKCNEEQLVNDMLSLLNITHSIQMTVDEGLDRDFLKLYPTDLESPGTVLSPRYIRELELVQQSGANVLLTGNGGDEMCWGHSLAYTQRLGEGDFGVVGEVLKACPPLDMPRLKTVPNLFAKPFLPEFILNVLRGSTKQTNDFITPIWLTSKAKELAHQDTHISNPKGSPRISKLKSSLVAQRLMNSFHLSLLSSAFLIV